MKKIKLLYLITGLTHGGAELVLNKIVSNLEKQTFEISICSLTDTVDILPLIRKHVEKIYFLGVKNLFSSIKALYKLRKIIKIENPDILHCFMFHANILGRLAAIGLKCKVVTSIRTKLIYNIFGNFIDNLTQNLVNIYMVNSKTLHNFISEYGIDKRKIVTINNGIELNKLVCNKEPAQIKKELNLPNLPIITMIANFKKQKDYPTMIKAIAHLQNEIDICFLAVGSGLVFEDETNKVLNLIKKLKLKNIKLLGFRKDIPEILSITDVWVSSTLFEGQSNSLLEAMAMKIPIVTTNIPENAELVRDKIEALLVPIKSPIKLANAIKKLLLDREFAKKLSENAYHTVSHNFEITRMFEKIKKLYNLISLKN